jgi:hypothetical protein
MTTARQLYMVLSPRALTYAQTALRSLFRNVAEPIDLHLITDSADDARELCETLTELQGAPSQSAPPFEVGSDHRWSVTSEEQLNDAEASLFARLPHLRAFRHGHPCWRKVTDPLLLAQPSEEMVLLDPDLYFPNRFRFEPTPAAGLALMWQQPNCLLPPQVVRAAFDARIALARHVDIGVLHWRAGSDLEWLDWMLGQLGNGAALPRLMHVEAIVWSAIAMREGGGYLDPLQWVCWHRTQARRIRRKLGVSGESILASESWSTMKCFHAGGEAKWWLPDYLAAHPHAPTVNTLGPYPLLPFTELTRKRYESEQSAKNLLHSLGYYRVFGAGAK